MSPLLVAIAFALVAAGGFALGLRYYRMSEPPGTDVSLRQARRFGRLLMLASAGMLLFLAAAILRGELKLGGAQ